METKDYGRYTLFKKLATGGMAEVFLARQKGLEGFEKLLVIKRILPHLADDEEFVAMFLNEARIAARFNHPNIVQIYDLGREEDTYFIAMEFIHGEDLGRIMRKAWQAKAWIPVPVALRIIAAVCEGLYYAHSKTDEHGNPLKVVHRDISPQNIIVSFDGGVKVVDFGIARAADQASTTRSGAIKGKYAYMSPEQASGKSVDHRSDIFAVGLVLFELLTGMRPLKRENDIMTLKAAVDCLFPRCSEVANVPPEIDRLVIDALARVADDRYPDARAFQMAIESFVIEQRLNASTIHISEMMRELFSERLSEEARLGEPVVLKSETAGAPVPPSQTGSKSSLLPRRPTKPGLLSVTGAETSDRPPPLPRIASAEWKRLEEGTADPGAPEEISSDELEDGSAAEAGRGFEEGWEAPAAEMPEQNRRATTSMRGSSPAEPPAPGPAAPPASAAEVEAFPGPRRRSLDPRPKTGAGTRPGAGKRTTTSGGRRRSLLYLTEDELEKQRREDQEQKEAERERREDEEERRRRTRRQSLPRRRRGGALPIVLLLLLAGGAGVVALHPELRQRALTGFDKLVADAKRGGEATPLDLRSHALLNLESNVAVDVYLGKQKLGTTPLKNLRIPAGRQALRLHNPNLGIEREITVHGDPGDTLRHREKFALGRVRFRAEKECEVFVNGRQVASYPGPPLDFFEGTYDVECRNVPLGLIGRQRVRIPKDSSRVVEVHFRLKAE